MIVLKSYIWKVSDLEGALEITWSLTAPRLPRLYKTRKTVFINPCAPKNGCRLQSQTLNCSPGQAEPVGRRHLLLQGASETQEPCMCSQCLSSYGHIPTCSWVWERSFRRCVLLELRFRNHCLSDTFSHREKQVL